MCELKLKRIHEDFILSLSNIWHTNLFWAHINICLCAFYDDTLFFPRKTFHVVSTFDIDDLWSLGAQTQLDLNAKDAGTSLLFLPM